MDCRIKEEDSSGTNTSARTGEIAPELLDMGARARKAAAVYGAAGTGIKNKALLAVAAALERGRDTVLAANLEDCRKAEAAGTGPALLDRLRLDQSRLDGIIGDIRKVASLDDPVGTVLDSRVLPNGLSLTRRRIPIGVIGVIYEARPNVTADIASLCLKTGNVCILRGGSETLGTNREMVRLIKEGLAEAGQSPDLVQFIDSTDRALVSQFLRMDQYIDMIIPRGGSRLSALCRSVSTIPVIVGGFGISHIFVDESADLTRSVPVIINSKVQRPSACNALDTLLLHRSVARAMLAELLPELERHNVSLVADPESFGILQALGCTRLEAAGPDTYDTEWLSMTLGIRVVDSLDDAIEHMRCHNATHSDAILTDSLENAKRFVENSGSAAVYVNASTRFTDGGQFGLGAEVAISTQKLHARGPMGLEALTTYRWICSGDYLIRN